MLLSRKTRLNLTDTQKQLMSKHAGISRFTYNWGLATWTALYQDGFKPNHLILKKFFNNQVKTALPWIKEKGICQKITQYAFENLGKAFKNFFEKRGDYPKFKHKGVNDSFTIDASGKPIPVGGKSIKLPTIGWVKTYESLPHTTCKSITISQRAGNWYIAFTYSVVTESNVKSYPSVGVDLGIKALATLSTGVVIENPKAYRKSQKLLARRQRQLQRKQKASHRYRKHKNLIAKTHKRVSDIRLDNTHKATTYICQNHAVVAIEDLNVQGMLSNHNLSGAVSDANFYEFRRQLEYKCTKFGSKLVVVDRWYPSSKTCSHCGHKQEMPLKERTFNCVNCGHSLDRDLNAAINLNNYARNTEGLPVSERGGLIAPTLPCETLNNV
jgi:putative transposase